MRIIIIGKINRRFSWKKWFRWCNVWCKVSSFFAASESVRRFRTMISRAIERQTRVLSHISQVCNNIPCLTTSKEMGKWGYSAFCCSQRQSSSPSSFHLSSSVSLPTPPFFPQSVKPCKSLSVLLGGRQAAIREEMTAFSFAAVTNNRQHTLRGLSTESLQMHFELRSAKEKMLSHWIGPFQRKRWQIQPLHFGTMPCVPTKHLNDRILRWPSDDRG